MDQNLSPSPNTQTDLVSAGIKAAALLSKNPFRTAFMATLGVGLARLILASLFFGAFGTVLYFIFGK